MLEEVESTRFGPLWQSMLAAVVTQKLLDSHVTENQIIFPIEIETAEGEVVMIYPDDAGEEKPSQGLNK